MINSLIPLCFTVTGMFLCLAILCIFKIREQKSMLTASKDIFDVYSEYVKEKLAKSKTDVTYNEYMIITIVAPIISVIVCYSTLHNLILSIIIAVVSFFIPDIYLRLMKEKNEKDFEAKYLRCLSQMSSSLRSGLSVEQAVEDVCKCGFVNDTLREEFERLNADLKFKVPMDEAFRRFAERTNSQDAMDVAAALTMQAEVGGNESKVVNDIATNINQRTMLRKEVNALFMDTTMTVLVMDVMPVVIVIGLNLYSKAYLKPFFESPEMTLLFIGLWVLMIIGSFVNQKMMRKVKKVQ